MFSRKSVKSSLNHDIFDQYLNALYEMSVRRTHECDIIATIVLSMLSSGDLTAKNWNGIIRDYLGKTAKKQKQSGNFRWYGGLGLNIGLNSRNFYRIAT